MGIKFVITAQLFVALKQNDLLGFDTPEQCAEAILTHDDWLTRWDFTQTRPREIGIIAHWYVQTMEKHFLTQPTA